MAKTGAGEHDWIKPKYSEPLECAKCGVKYATMLASLPCQGFKSILKSK